MKTSIFAPKKMLKSLDFKGFFNENTPPFWLNWLRQQNNFQKERGVFMSILPENYEKERTRSPRFSSFLKDFKLNQLFRKWNIHKEKGISAKEAFHMIFLLAFTGKSFSGFLHSRKNPFQGKKDPVSRFLELSRCNCWNKFFFSPKKG